MNTKKNNKISVSIVGASGYAGGELLRLLLDHPHLELKQLTSRKYRKLPVTIAHPNLRGLTDLRFVGIDELKPVDLLILGLPNGESQKEMDHYLELADKVIDLGADYRLSSSADYQKWYGEHSNDKHFGKFNYGIAEINRENLVNADYVACGGCEATCGILALAPLARAGILGDAEITLDVKIGSSAAGGAPGLSSHHPERSGAVRTYKPTSHRHTAEIQEHMSKLAGARVEVAMTATAIEMVRGILLTAHIYHSGSKLNHLDLVKIYKDFYEQEKFVRIINEKFGIYRYPEPKLVAGTNFADIGLAVDETEYNSGRQRLVVIGAIDNLVKGTAGQALQALNLMYGFPEDTALNFSGLHPV